MVIFIAILDLIIVLAFYFLFFYFIVMENNICVYDCKDHSLKKMKKKKKKKMRNIYKLLIVLSICIIYYFNLKFFSVSAKNINKEKINPHGIITSSVPNDNINIIEANEKEHNRNYTTEELLNNNEEIKNEELSHSSDDKEYDKDIYKEKFLGDDFVSNVELIKNSKFIINAVNFLIKGYKQSYTTGEKEHTSLRNGNDNPNAAEIKKLIIIKLLKCIGVLILCYIAIRLVFSFFKKVINLIFTIIFKIFKCCCCGGK
ncbi:conserved Plasmodium protein, unknown function [Plasmodium sp. gorilla clade G1]|nr:conserved Plasmodium protein, unknown function [Plasmodium sp. gorilla clade G1]